MAHILGAAAVTATMAQGPQSPWNNDHEAELYAKDPREFLLDRCQMWMDNIHWFGNYVIAATYYLPAYETLPGGQSFIARRNHKMKHSGRARSVWSSARGRWPLSMTTATSSTVRT